GGGRDQRRTLARARHGRERQLALAARDLPEREMTIARQRAQRAGIGQRLELAALERGAARELLHARERRFRPSARDAPRRRLAEAFHQAQAEAQRGFVVRAA